MSLTTVDVLVVGGGINGVGIARDLAGRGYAVILAEQDDLGAHTSSASTKLIHGGLRYLAQGQWSLVRKALQEREVLLRSAPHLIRPLSFVMPHDPTQRPAWMIRLGLMLYDHLAHRDILPASRRVHLDQHPLGHPLQAQYKTGFVYTDGWVDDARLVILNALDARTQGAQIWPRTRCTHAQRHAQHWEAVLQGSGLGHGPTECRVRARALVNATGPWADTFLRDVTRPWRGEALTTQRLRLVKGSHIVVPRCFAHDHAYIFQNPDQRVTFALPYEERFTLIGTTDQPWQGPPQSAHIDPAEMAYLCAQVNRYVTHPLRADQVVWHYAGVRPLLDDASDNPTHITRDYLLETSPPANGAPLLNVWGGKITTYRKLAQEAAHAVGTLLGDHPGVPWTHQAHLPGGDMGLGTPHRDPTARVAQYLENLIRGYPWLPQVLAQRWTHAYGSRVHHILNKASQLDHLGDQIAPGVYEAELDYLYREEWASTGDDVLWRRSKLGLHLSPAQQDLVTIWMANRPRIHGGFDR